MSEQIGIDINGIHITEEDLERQATKFNKDHGVSITDLVDKVIKGLHSPHFEAQASVSTASLLNPHCKPWLGAVFSTDPVQMVETDKAIKHLLTTCRPPRPVIERCDDELLLLELTQKYFGFANVAKVAFQSMISLSYRHPEHVKVTGRGMTFTKNPTDFSKCVVHYVLTNYQSLGADLPTFIDQVHSSYIFTKLTYGYDIYIDQVEPAVFRMRPIGKNVPTTFTWKQVKDGYSLKRDHR